MELRQLKLYNHINDALHLQFVWGVETIPHRFDFLQFWKRHDFKLIPNIETLKVGYVFDGCKLEWFYTFAVGISVGCETRPNVDHSGYNLVFRRIGSGLMRQHAVENIAQIVTMTNTSHLMAAKYNPNGVAQFGIVIESIQIRGCAGLPDTVQSCPVYRVPELSIWA